eukprot:5896128-Alexandrium_andersonii.AAC.2
MVLRRTASGVGPGVIARELALDVARAAYKPSVAEHVPGVANKTCDILSRLYEPGKSVQIPSRLTSVPRVRPPARNAEFFPTLAHP